MQSFELRSRFLKFFNSRNHEIVSSSSLIPAQDPTLLFANAGMNQFKDVFLGNESRSYNRAVSIQKCVRAGGKHNDLDNVGFTRRHLTFFEMMGNFSFGDYFKKEAIQFAWEFLTKEAGLPVEKLYISVYETDDESYAIWNEIIGVPKDKIYRLGKESNFWQMGDLGPCGPCTETFIDQGPDFGCADKNSCGPDCDCDRFLEIWNLVFMQFDRQHDGTLKPLKKTGVDTGMGLERLCAVVQKKESVYHTDLFWPIIETVEQLTEKKYVDATDLQKAAFHVLADHIRSSTMLIADGCAPSNEGRGYVLRKIIRRAALFAQKLTALNIIPDLSLAVIKQLGSIYKELLENQATIYSVLLSETTKFSANLVRGNSILQQYIKQAETSKIISGTHAFLLYDTYGFPIELTIAAAREQGLSVDVEKFEKEMQNQKQQSGKKESDALSHIGLDESITTQFTGYQELETTSTVSALICQNTITQSVQAGETCFVIVKESPFFIVGGGQVPDQGWLVINGTKTPILQVRYINTAIAAQIIAPSQITVGDTITSIVDPVWRTNAMKNHTATHLLQSALMELFGKQIKQSGSLVHPDYLRFDFTYHTPLTAQELCAVENLVNEKIRENIPVTVKQMSLKQATQEGALAFFGDKYKPDCVRMVCVDEFSRELCGGTHVRATGDIGTFKIIDESSPSAGHRRIVAVTGPRAIELFQEQFSTVKNLCYLLKTKPHDLVQTANSNLATIKGLEKEIHTLKQEVWKRSIAQWQEQIQTIGSTPCALIHIDGATATDLKEIATLLQQSKAALYFLYSVHDSKPLFVCSLHPSLKNSVNIKELATALKDQHGLRGGAQEYMIQGGGNNPLNSETLLKTIKTLLN